MARLCRHCGKPLPHPEHLIPRPSPGPWTEDIGVILILGISMMVMLLPLWVILTHGPRS